MEYHCGETAIISREEMFRFIAQSFDETGKEDMETANRYFQELIKPIVEEMKRFYKGYMVGMAQNNQTICESIQLPRICSIVANAVYEQLSKEMLYGV